MVHTRRTFVTTLFATACLPRMSLAQQLRSLNPGGGYHQLARAMQDALNAEKLASGSGHEHNRRWRHHWLGAVRHEQRA
jgi:hypothetical protein